MIDALISAIDAQRLVANCAQIVSVPAPTGYERSCTQAIVEILNAAGLDGQLAELDDRSASAWARIAAPDHLENAPTVLLYSPIDTVTTGDPADDVPQAAAQIVGHLLPEAVVSDDGTTVTGLGAQNPKGHAAAILEAAAVLGANRGTLPCHVIVGFGAGGMPTFPLDHDDRTDTGHGIGVDRLLDVFAENNITPDACIVAKSGWFVQHEEVGLAWSTITVRGTHTYVGARHRLPYRNAIADAATIILELERRFAKQHDRLSDTLEPQAMVSSVFGGWNRMNAFTPEQAELKVDQRTLPGESGAEAHARIKAALADLRQADPGLDASAELSIAIPGSFTEPDHWICELGRQAWEAIEGRTHETPTGLSGSTDANIIRNRGIPTMRIGLPKVHRDGVELGFAEGMNTVDANAMATLTELLIRCVAGVGGVAGGAAPASAP